MKLSQKENLSMIREMQADIVILGGGTGEQPRACRR